MELFPLLDTVKIEEIFASCESIAKQVSHLKLDEAFKQMEKWIDEAFSAVNQNEIMKEIK
jgi:hypothetical protein